MRFAALCELSGFLVLASLGRGVLVIRNTELLDSLRDKSAQNMSGHASEAYDPLKSRGRNMAL